MRWRRLHLLVALLALAVVVAAACGGTDDTTTSATTTSAADSGGRLQGLALPTADGGQLDFNDLEGKPALLWFWAPW